MKKTILYIFLAFVGFLYGQTQINWNTQLRNRPNITRTGSNATWTDNVTNTGSNIFTTENNVPQLSPGNPQLWSGSDPGAQLNSALTAAQGLGTNGCHVIIAPGSYSATTSVTIPTQCLVELKGGTTWASNASPNFLLNGTGASLKGAMFLNSNLQNTNAAGGTAIQVANGATIFRISDLTITGFAGSGNGITMGTTSAANYSFGDIHNIRFSAVAQCVSQTLGASQFTRISQAFCNATTSSPGFNFDNTGGTGLWLEFDQSYACGIGGAGVGYKLANASVAFIRTGADICSGGTSTGYLLGTATGSIKATFNMTDDEGQSAVGIDIEGPGQVDVMQHNCGTLGAAANCIKINSAANVNIANLESAAGTNTNDLLFTANATGSIVLNSIGGLTKAISATAPATYCVTTSNKLSCGGSAAAGSTGGDITAQRSNTTGFVYFGGSGTNYLGFNGTAFVVGASSWLPSTTGFNLGAVANPWGQLFLGTAATNNFQFAPAATAAARVVSIPDPLTNVNLAFNLSATSAAFATATTAGTCVQNTTAVSGAATTMVATASPVSTPGVGAQWSAFVSSAGNVTINECAVAASAGGTIAFNIRVTP